ncbi:MAG: hypothetical protein RBU21_24100 [FCB group bacterium]|jgi:endonuclease YncB( thermonuclease family)|nr:hypothetical protein [FCB group bacterium]
MDYRIEIFDRSGRRLAVYDEAPLLEAVRTSPDQPDLVRGILPAAPKGLEHGCLVRVWVAGRRFCDARITRIDPQWGATRKLILDRYVTFHEVIAIEAERAPGEFNTPVASTFGGREIAAMVKTLVNEAPGPLHYGVAHRAYPDGAQREYAKLLARKTSATELAHGSIAAGQWVGANRIDASNAYALDGDTIAGLVVDGALWPDLRLAAIECEERTRNAHAIALHPEIADWSDARYLASGYRLRAEAARAGLQHLIDTKGIAYIELNPHRDASGAFDARIDAYGRYVGLVYGGGECFNAALVEQGHAIVDLNGHHDPALESKDFYSYACESVDTVMPTSVTLGGFDFQGGVLEAIDALAYAAGGFVWSVNADSRLGFRPVAAPDRALYYRAERVGVGYGSESESLGNSLAFEGSPFTELVKTYANNESIAVFGEQPCNLALYAIAHAQDADRLAAGLLDDVAYPAVAGFVTVAHGDATFDVGDVIELRGEPVRRLNAGLPGEWGGRFAGRAVGRVSSVTQRFSGRQVTTRIELTSPLRTVGNPLTYMTRSQQGAENLYQFRLDDLIVGADAGFHLD